MKTCLLFLAIVIAVPPFAASPLEGQELSEEALNAILEGRQFEVGRTRTSTRREAPPEEDSAEDEPAAAGNPARALFGAAAKAAAVSGAALDAAENSGVAGLAKSLLGVAAGREGDDTTSALGALGQSLVSGAVAEATSSIAAKGLDPAQLTGAAQALIQQTESRLEVDATSDGSDSHLSAGTSIEQARALLDRFNSTVNSEDIDEVAETVEDPPAPTVVRATPRAQPSRPGTLERDDEEREPLPWATGSRQTPSDDAAGAGSRSPVRSVEARSIPQRVPVADEGVSTSRPTIAEPSPARNRDLGDGTPSFELAVAEREGDWFVVLGSYRLRPGADVSTSPAEYGSVERSANGAIAGAQQRLWNAGYVPWVVSSDEVPGFRGGLAVIVLGPMTQSDAAAELTGLRHLVHDAYIKAGW